MCLSGHESVFLSSYPFQILNGKLFRPVPGTSGILEGNKVLLCSQIRILFFVKVIPNLMDM